MANHKFFAVQIQQLSFGQPPRHATVFTRGTSPRSSLSPPPATRSKPEKGALLMSTPQQIAANQANGIGDREPENLPSALCSGEKYLGTAFD
jgi:hypothetical protein